MRLPIPGFISRHPKKSIAATVVVLLIIIGVATRGPAEPEYLTEVAKKGDLRQTVEAVGTIISERELQLQFSGIGIVQSVSVKEGDRVRAGQRLAQLRSGNLGASIASQQASYQSALAELRALEEGSRPEDIAVAEADLQSKRAALEVAKASLASSEKNLKTAEDQRKSIENEASVSLSGQVSTSLSSLDQELTDIETSLFVIDDVLNNIEVSDAMIRDNPGADNEVRAQKRSAQDTIAIARRDAAAASDYEAALVALQSGLRAASTSTVAMDNLFFLVSAVRETSNFTNADREAVKADISVQRNSLQSSNSAIATLQSSLKNASASYDTKISAQKASIASYQGTRDRAKTDILTYEAAIRSSEAQLALKRAGTRKADLDAARARVRAAQANLARAQADFGDTVLTAPIAGVITHLNIKVGETLPSGPAVTLLGDSPFRVEMFVSEIDVPKLQLTQSGSIELDAFRGVNMKLRLSEVDSSPTLKDGVSKYGLMLDFLHLHPELKIGMTGDAEVVTGLRQNVVNVPSRAVLEKPDGSLYVRIPKADKTVEERVVTTGMESESGDIEILTGLEGGETIIVLEKK